MNIVEALKKYDKIKRKDWISGVWLEFYGLNLYVFSNNYDYDGLLDYHVFDCNINDMLAEDWHEYIKNQ